MSLLPKEHIEIVSGVTFSALACAALGAVFGWWGLLVVTGCSVASYFLARLSLWSKVERR